MANELEQAGAISTEKQTYRSYVKTESDANGKTVIKEIQTKAGAQKIDKDSGLPSNWADLEKDGYTLWNENEFVRYTVKTVEGAQLLVPDETQFIYIFQSGLNYLQNAKANAAMKAEQEGTPEPTPLFNQDTIDLRSGTDENGKYSINEAPTRKSLSDIDKLRKLLSALGVPEDKQEAVIAAMSAAPAATEETEVEE